jgi:hypothetical protein
MLFLAGDVLPQRDRVGPANRENRITFLPRKQRIIILGDLNGGGFFEFSNEVRRSVGCPDTYQQMDVVLNSAYGFGDHPQAAERSAQVLVKPRAPFCAN